MERLGKAMYVAKKAGRNNGLQFFFAHSNYYNTPIANLVTAVTIVIKFIDALCATLRETNTHGAPLQGIAIAVMNGSGREW